MNKNPFAQRQETRQENTSRILRDLHLSAPLSRAMLADRNDLSRATVSAICGDLKAMGLIRRVGKDVGGLGRPGILLELDPEARSVIGVEISTNYLAAVLTNMGGQLLWESATPIPVRSDLDTILVQAESLVEEAMDAARQHEGLGPLLGIGVGVPGAVDPGEESLVTTPSLGWTRVPLKRELESRFALPVLVDSRARAAAVAEGLGGSAQGVDNYLYVSLGTDVGASVEAAVICDGLPYGGAHGLALEVGHMVLDPEGPACVCGQRGCWQAMTNVDREVAVIRPRLEAGEPSVLQETLAGNSLELDHRAIHQAAMDGDALAIAVVEEVNFYHVIGITNLVRLFDPQMVVIGWASAGLPENYMSRMRALSKLPGIDALVLVPQYLAERGVPCPTITYATHLHSAASLGAAALVVDDFLRYPPVNEI